MKKILLVITIVVFASCKKDKSSSATKRELLTEKPWALISQEIFHPVKQVWEFGSGEAGRLHYFYTDGTVEKKNSSGGGSPSAYPIVKKGTWSFADGEKSLNHAYFLFMLSPVVIEELSPNKMVLITTETGTLALKYRDTYVHP